MNCRHCDYELLQTFLDLGSTPPSNAYLTEQELSRPELYFPLRLKVCTNCWLVQTIDYSSVEELFTSEYAYFSSTSTSWLAHASNYARMITHRLELNSNSFVIEVASNDGYLLKNFVSEGIPCLGIEPTDSTAKAAEKLSIPVLREFFRLELAETLAKKRKQADLIIANNVFAHVPDINDFAAGLKTALKPDGTITLEFPHLMRLIEGVQFDTVYHEHFSYLSLSVVQRIFNQAGLKIWDVEELTTHGGSLRVYGGHAENSRQIHANVSLMLEQEMRRGLEELNLYLEFQAKANRVKNDLLTFLIEQKRMGKCVLGYGAAAKGNTLLNYAGVKSDLLPIVCDAAAAKQGKFMPGSHIPILAPTELNERHPDYLLILPWNIAAEVMEQNASLAQRGTRFITAIPRLEIV